MIPEQLTKNARRRVTAGFYEATVAANNDRYATMSSIVRSAPTETLNGPRVR